MEELKRFLQFLGAGASGVGPQVNNLPVAVAPPVQVNPVLPSSSNIANVPSPAVV